jgi:hypothetical protein
MIAVPSSESTENKNDFPLKIKQIKFLCSHAVFDDP